MPPPREPDAAAGGPPLPEHIGHYEVLRLIGRGGMGAVYEAVQKNPSRHVAVKVIDAAFASPELLRRFEVEGQILGRLQHPGIAQIYEADTFDSGHGPRPYFAMEFVQGVSLTEHAEQHALGTRARLQLFAKVCDALHHAHLRGVVHRDLKPGNILVDESGQPKVLDFGVARATDGDVQTTTLRTDIGQLLGTVPYMSPEQATGDPTLIDLRSDVYSLGVLAYQLLSGRMPYAVQGKLVHEAVRIIREEDPTPLSSLNPVFRGDIETIVGKALEKDGQRRYASAAELASDVRRYLADEPIAARPPSASYQLRKFASRNKALVGGLAAVLVALVLGLAGTAWGLVRARAGEREASEAQVAEAQQRVLAEESARAARASEEIAQAEARRATLVAQFTQGILKSVDPETAQGEDTALLERMLDDAAARLDSELSEAPAAEAALRGTIGEAYSMVGRNEAAEPHVVRALELSLALYGPDDLRTITDKNRIAIVRSRQGRYAESIAIHEENLVHARVTLGTSDHLTLQTERNLGSTYLYAGNTERAAEILDDVLRRERPNSLPELRTKDALGLILLGRGEFERAEPLLDDAQRGLRESLGPDHPAAIRALANWSGLQKELGRRQEAAQLDAEVLERARRIMGPAHPETLRFQQNLGCVLRDLGRYAEATELLRETLDTLRQVLGPEHPETLSVEVMLARVLQTLDQLGEAEGLIGHVLEVRERELGPEAFPTLEVREALALLYARGPERRGEGCDMMSAVAAAMIEERGDRDVRVLMALQNLGFIQQGCKRFDEAAATFSAALEGRREMLGEHHPDTLMTLNSYAVALLGAGDHAGSEPLFREALAVQRETIGAAHPDTLITLFNLGWVQHYQDRHEDAAAAFREVYDGFATAYGPRHPRPLAAASALLTELGELGRSEEAAQWQARIDGAGD